MLGLRTPTKTPTPNSSEETEKSPNGKSKESTNSVRKSIGEWEAGKPELHSKIMTYQAKKSLNSTFTQQITDNKTKSEELTKSYLDRKTIAKQCLIKAKLQLNNSRNIKTEIKEEVIAQLDKLYRLVVEAETQKVKGKRQENKDQREETIEVIDKEMTMDARELAKAIHQHTELIRENTIKMETLNQALTRHQVVLEAKTYAAVTATQIKPSLVERTALHSVTVTSKNETETGDEILERIRKAANAKEGNFVVDSIRKAKDRKIIIGCKTQEQRNQLKEKLQSAGSLKVEEMQNKKPLIMLKSVLKLNTDDDIIASLKNQNKSIFGGISMDMEQIDVLYKKNNRNPHTHSVVVRVSPIVWKRLVEAETVHIDLQRIHVTDQSPLIQCSLCLGYGHSRRFCKETQEKCSHCGGAHVRAKCEEWLAGTIPTCCNCTRARYANAEHSAFSEECPVRRKWESLARATTMYC